MDMKELDRRIKKGVRKITISPLFKKDVTYSLDTYKEDKNGTLRPSRNHCWLKWQSKWINSEGEEHWSGEAYSYNSLQEAREGKSYLEKHLI